MCFFYYFDGSFWDVCFGVLNDSLSSPTKMVLGDRFMNLYVVNIGLVLVYKEGSVDMKWIEFRYIYNVLFCWSLLNN